MPSETIKNIKPTARKIFAIIIITLSSFFTNIKLFQDGRISLSFIIFAISIALMILVMKYKTGSK